MVNLACFDVELDGTEDISRVVDALSISGAEVLQLDEKPDCLFVLDVSEDVLLATPGIKSYVKVERL